MPEEQYIPTTLDQESPAAITRCFYKPCAIYL